MKKIQLAIAAAGMLVASVMPASAQLFNWSGFYYGASAGYNRHWTKIWDDGGWFVGGTQRYDVEGFIFGLNAGQNFQSGIYVYGYEGDISYSTASGTNNFGGTSDPVHQDARFIATLRSRFGVAQDRTLYYLTGGFAFSNSKTVITQSPSWVSKDFNYGGVVGGGIEQALANNPNWTWRIEALWLLFARQGFDDGVSSYPMRYQNSDLIVRIGLNVKK